MEPVVPGKQRSRAPLWLVVAALLFALAGWLMSGSDDEAPPERAQVQFPRYLRADEHRRMNQRRTLAPLPQPPDPPGPQEPRPAPPRRDPVLVALPPATPGERHSAVVFEANALRHSPLGKLFLDCLLSEHELADLDELEKQTGVNVLEDVDRIAVSDEVAVITGHFAGARWDAVAEHHRTRAYGEKGVYYEPEGGGEGFAVWGGEMLLFGKSPEELEQAIDRLEGRAEAGPPAIPESATYGEIYGVIDSSHVAELLPPDQRQLAERLQGAAERIELHVDATGDVAIVADVRGPDDEQVSDLGKSLGAALALGRLKAQAEGEQELSELLDVARVEPGGGGRFNLQVALPLPLLQRALGPCRPGSKGVPEAGIPPAPVEEVEEEP